MYTSHHRDSLASIHHVSSCGGVFGRVNLDLQQKFCRLLPRAGHDQYRLRAQADYNLGNDMFGLALLRSRQVVGEVDTSLDHNPADFQRLDR